MSIENDMQIEYGLADLLDPIAVNVIKRAMTRIGEIRRQQDVAFAESSMADRRLQSLRDLAVKLERVKALRRSAIEAKKNIQPERFWDDVLIACNLILGGDDERQTEAASDIICICDRCGWTGSIYGITGDFGGNRYCPNCGRMVFLNPNTWIKPKSDSPGS